MANVSEEELDDIKERFEIFDKKGDHKVDCCQIIDVLRACGLNPLQHDVDKVKFASPTFSSYAFFISYNFFCKKIV